MNAISPLVPAPSSWAETVLQLNSWRGRCTDIFARAEAAVTETLIALAAVPKRGDSVTLPHLVGARFSALAKLIGPDGAFAAEGKSAVKAVSAFQAHDMLRATLCHGVATLTKDQKGEGYMLFHIAAIRGGKLHAEVAVFDETYRNAINKKLSSDAQRLNDTLAKLRAAVFQTSTKPKPK